MANHELFSTQNLNCEVPQAMFLLILAIHPAFGRLNFRSRLALQQTPFYSWFLRSLWLTRHPICMFSIFRRAFRGL